MDNFLPQPENGIKTASTQPRGGCFSVLFAPIFILICVFAFLLMAMGETTQPWELGAAGRTANATAASSQDSLLAPFFAPSVLFWEDEIIAWAEEWNLDPNLVATIMQIESCGDPRALSPSGAMGLFQVMPYHFTTSDAPYNPNTNAMRGLAYLSKAMDTYSTIRLAFASYNGGIGTAAKPDSLWPQETIRYVYWGTNIYKDASKAKTTSPTLEEWFSAGGTHLCEQANSRLGLKP